MRPDTDLFGLRQEWAMNWICGVALFGAKSNPSLPWKKMMIQISHDDDQYKIPLIPAIFVGLVNLDSNFLATWPPV